MIAVQLPPDLPIACVLRAAKDYQLPPAILYAIRRVEGGALGQKVLNRNGTLDYGPMQINTVWVSQFEKKEGVTRRQIAHDPCMAVRAAAYILRSEINRVRDFWQAVGNYHSRSPVHHVRYRDRVYDCARGYDKLLRQQGVIG
jgi:soluble lytic murein transglycosylase-like protein